MSCGARTVSLSRRSKSSRPQQVSSCGSATRYTADLRVHRRAQDRFGVVPICRALAEHGVQIAPRTYWAHRRRHRLNGRCGTPRSPRSWPAIYEPEPRRKRPPESLYGSLKMWAHLQRQGIPVARCTVERMMRGQRLARGDARPPDTHHRGRSDANRAPDLVRQRFRWADPTRCTLPTSPTRRSPAAGSATPRSSSTPTPG